MRHWRLVSFKAGTVPGTGSCKLTELDDVLCVQVIVLVCHGESGHSVGICGLVNRLRILVVVEVVHTTTELHLDCAALLDNNRPTGGGRDES